MTATIRSLDTRLVRVPLSRPWGPDVTELSVIETVVADSDGATGYGFSWTPTIGAASVQAMLDHDITSFAAGRAADAAELWPALWRHLHEAGGGGVTTIAMAGLDLALWDLAGRRADASVVDLVGRTQETAEVYGSGVNLHYPLEELVAQAERWVAAGYDAVKVKVGSPDLARDVERLAALRDVLGPDRRLMIDANQRWSLDQATAALEALATFDPAWIEEPLRADDLPAHAELRRRTDVPIALGENVHTRYRFAEFLDAGVVDVPGLAIGVQPVVRGVVDAAKRNTRPVLVAFAGVVVHDVENDLESRIMDGANHLEEFGDRVDACKSRHRGEEADGVVAPEVSQAALHEVVLVDERVQRKEFDRGNAERADVLQDFRVAHAGEAAPVHFRHGFVQHRVAAEIGLVEHRVRP